MKYLLIILLFLTACEYSFEKAPVDTPMPDSAYQPPYINEPGTSELKLSARLPKSFFISPSGSDANTGTIDKPFFSLLKFWDVCQPGDTLFLRGGTYKYTKSQYLQGKNGTNTAKINVWGYKDEKAIISVADSYNGNVEQDLIYIEGEHYYFKGFEIAYYAQKKGVYAWPAFRGGAISNSKFENIYYHHNGAGMSIRNGTNNEFINCDFSHNQDPYSSSPYDGADGLDLHYIKAGASNTVKNCRFWWNADDGLDLWDNNGYVLIENCWSFYNGYIPGTFTTAGNGSGFKLGSTGGYPTKLLRTVKNNIAYKNGSYGFVENQAICKSDIINNTASDNGEIGYWFGSWGTNVATLTNNISWKSPQLSRLSTHDVQVNNSWNGKTVKESDFLNATTPDQLMSARIKNQLPSITFLQLTPNSPLKGLGAKFDTSGVIIPPDTITPPPVDTSWTYVQPLNQYSNKTADNKAKPNANKVLWFKAEIYKRNGKYKIEVTQ